MNVKKWAAVLLAAAVGISLAGCGGGVSSAEESESGYKVAMITDSGEITDQSFNQMAYEACRDWCGEHGVPFTYKKPDGDTDYARTAMVDVAVAEGYNILVLPGFTFARTVVETTRKYPEVKFVCVELSEGDIISAAVGGEYYANPSAYSLADYYNPENTFCSTYQEEISGYLAGFAAVKLGYRKLGYLGGLPVPGVMRFGYGYLQGIDDAAEELGVTDDISVQYAYGGQFFGSPEITAVMDTWYGRGTEVVFACGGGIYTSAAEAAAKTGGKVIGVDIDQAPVIDAFGKGLTVTSAMKNLRATINTLLNSIVIDGTFSEHAGRIENMGLVSGTDMSLNYVGLPEESTQWNEGFTREDYHELVRKIYDGEILIDNSLDQMPDVQFRLDVRQGTIM